MKSAEPCDRGSGAGEPVGSAERGSGGQQQPKGSAGDVVGASANALPLPGRPAADGAARADGDPASGDRLAEEGSDEGSEALDPCASPGSGLADEKKITFRDLDEYFRRAYADPDFAASIREGRERAAAAGS